MYSTYQLEQLHSIIVISKFEQILKIALFCCILPEYNWWSTNYIQLQITYNSEIKTMKFPMKTINKQLKTQINLQLVLIFL
jgi:hypothetical protein